MLPDGWQLFVQAGVVADFIEFEEEQAGPAAQQVAPLERAEPLVAAAKQREQPHVAQTRGGAGNGCAFGEERCMGVEVLQGLLRFSQKEQLLPTLRCAYHRPTQEPHRYPPARRSESRGSHKR